MQYFDITPKIDSRLAVFPGDTPFTRSVELDMDNGANLTLSSIKCSLHIGAHADAPSHYARNAQGIDQRALDYYLGRAQVIWVNAKDKTRIKPSDIDHVAITAERVLIRTGSFPNPMEWRNDFTALSPELIDELAKKKVKLVGIDTPSIDPATAKDLTSHASVHKNDMAILEGIVLDHVPQGEYVLVALPLPIVEGDASPVRAILLPAASDPWRF